MLSQQLSDFAVYSVIFTLLVSSYFVIGIKKKDILTVDGIFSIIGLILGLFVTFLNLVYISSHLFLLGPIIVISSLYYLKNRSSLSSIGINKEIVTNLRHIKFINILFLSFFSLSLISYHISPMYHRELIFFMFISVCVALIGVEIFTINTTNKFLIRLNIFKILLISLIIRGSAYFVSPYPIGSDPWVHIEYLNEFLYYNSLYVTPGIAAIPHYYANYPIAHLFTIFCYYIPDLSITNSIFIIGLVLTFSTIFIYIFVVKLTNNIQIALLAFLLVNISGYHIQWGIEIIAMSYGLAVYTIIMYLAFSSNEKTNSSQYILLFILFLFLLVYTHTISSFIMLVSLLILFLSAFAISKSNYFKSDTLSKLKIRVTFNLLLILGIIMFIAWTDSSYPFFDRVFSGLIHSLTQEVSVAEGTSVSIIGGTTLGSISLYFGEYIYISMGILGTLICLSNKNINKNYLCLISMIFVLYIFRYLFPLLGIRNIIPDRWPVFILITFCIFISIGYLQFISLIKDRKKRVVFLLLFLSFTSFLMITNSYSNKDSPIYSEDTIQRMVWTESEMALFNNINNTYDGIIITDQQTARRPFEAYLRRDFNLVSFYHIDNGEINYNLIDENLVIWRKSSLYRPVTVKHQSSRADIVLGKDFYDALKTKYSCVYDVGEARAYR